MLQLMKSKNLVQWDKALKLRDRWDKYNENPTIVKRPRGAEPRNYEFTPITKQEQKEAQKIEADAIEVAAEMSFGADWLQEPETDEQKERRLANRTKRIEERSYLLSTKRIKRTKVEQVAKLTLLQAREQRAKAAGVKLMSAADIAKYEGEEKHIKKKKKPNSNYDSAWVKYDMVIVECILKEPKNTKELRIYRVVSTKPIPVNSTELVSLQLFVPAPTGKGAKHEYKPHSTSRVERAPANTLMSMDIDIDFQVASGKLTNKGSVDTLVFFYS